MVKSVGIEERDVCCVYGSMRLNLKLGLFSRARTLPRSTPRASRIQFQVNRDVCES